MAIKDLRLVKTHMFICNGGSCKLNGAEESTSIIRKTITDNGLTDNVHTTKTMCNGRCKDGPIVISMPKGIWFKQIDPSKAAAFVCAHLLSTADIDDQILYHYGSDHINAVMENNPNLETHD